MMRRRQSTTSIALVLLLVGLAALTAPAPTSASTVNLPEDNLGLMLYGTNTGVPTTRAYASSTNSFAPDSAIGASGTFQRFSSLKTSPTKGEAIATFRNSSHSMSVMCFNGQSWSQDLTFSVTSTSQNLHDIAYETASGDVMVLYSTNSSGSNQLAYRTKPGNTGCGTANWSSATTLTSARITNAVRWVQLEADPRPGSNIITGVWNDVDTRLSAMQWSGTAWGNEPAAALETAVTQVSSFKSFDVAYETLSGNVMVAWGDRDGSDGVNGAYYARCTGGTASCTWTTKTAMPTFSDDVATIDIAANPVSNEIAFASIGIGAGVSNESDLQIGYWSGSAWTNTANADTTSSLPQGHYQTVAVSWVHNNGHSRSIVYYRDADANLSWFVGNGGTFTKQSDSYALGSVQLAFAETDPIKFDNAMFTFTNAAGSLLAKRIVIDGSGNLTWSQPDGGSSLASSLSTTIANSVAFAYWRMNPTVGNHTLNAEAVIEPLLDLAIGSHAGACNGVAQTAGSSSTNSSVALGPPTPLMNSVAAQSITITTNARSGYTTFIRSSGALTTGANTIPNLAATNASPSTFPAAGTAAFGYTTSESTLSGGTADRFTSPGARWAGLTGTDQPVSYSATGQVAKSVCVGFQVGISGTNPAGSYGTTVTYTAVPQF